MRLKYLIAPLLITSMSGLNAAVINWTLGTQLGAGDVPTGTFDTSDVVTQILAENSGGVATTYDGISFSAGSISFGAAYASFNPTTTLADTISSPGTYGAGASAQTVTINGLTGGNDYRIQMLVMDGRTGFVPSKSLEIDGVDMGAYKPLNGQGGRLFIGNFKADGISQLFTNETFRDDSGVSLGGLLNAIVVQQVTAIPEPSSAALLGLGGIALILRRRK